MSPAELKTGHLEKFQLETLFYIFYAMPKDQLQGFAAQELYNRKWKYHKVCSSHTQTSSPHPTPHPSHHTC
jgi:CCR4-NOT transcriptional regulation complex NOT5 subunit